MIGIEILAAEEVACAFAFNWPMFWIVFGITFVISGIIMFCCLLEDCCNNKVTLAGIITIVIFLATIISAITGGLFADGIFPKSTEYETQYKVTIDDSVSMNDFNEKYEVIDQEGKIYTVRERE